MAPGSVSCAADGAGTPASGWRKTISSWKGGHGWLLAGEVVRGQTELVLGRNPGQKGPWIWELQKRGQRKRDGTPRETAVNVTGWFLSDLPVP